MEDREEFLRLVGVIEKAIEVAGNRIFAEETRAAYVEAHRIASRDNTSLRELDDRSPAFFDRTMHGVVRIAQDRTISHKPRS
jgi:hypothetical protein